MIRKIFEEIKFIYEILNKADYQLLVQSLSYYSVFALVPLIACFLMVFENYGGVFRFQQNFLPDLLDFLSMGAGQELVREGIQSSLDRVNNGALGLTSAVFFFFVANILLAKIDTAIQKIWQVDQNRRLFTRFLLQMGILLLGPISLSFLFGLSSAAAGTVRLDILSSLLYYSIVFGLLFSVYQFWPRKKVKLGAAFLAAFAALIALLLAKEAFWFLTKYVFSYNKIYGTLAAIPIFLLWIYTLWSIFLSGVVLSYRLSISKESFFRKGLL